MNFLDFMSILNNVTSPDIGKSLWGGAGFTFGLGGACFMASALFPQYKWTFKVKNTVGVNIPMFTFHTVVALLFLIGSCYMIYAASENAIQDCYFGVLTGSVFTLLNVYGFIGNAYIVLLKLLHANGAKRAGVTESQYYETHVQPKLRSAAAAE